MINIWDLWYVKGIPRTIKEHSAAVRAIKWCPWDTTLLATGGGSGDMWLLIHNTNKQTVVK